MALNFPRKSTSNLTEPLNTDSVVTTTDDKNVSTEPAITLLDDQEKPASESVSAEALTQTVDSALTQDSQPVQLTGKCGFTVQTTPAGMAVNTVFITEQGQVLAMPAVFPDLMYALSQVDGLRNLLIKHFSEAAAAGARVISEQTAVPASV